MELNVVVKLRRLTVFSSHVPIDMRSKKEE